MAPLVEFPCSLPTAFISQDIDATTVASSFTSELGHLTAENFTEDAIWRDIFALTGTLRTFYSSSSIATAWKETSTRAELSSFSLDQRSVRVSRLPGGSSWIEARFLFETNTSPATTCSAIVSLVPESDGKWKIWVMRTVLEQLKSEANVDELEFVGDTKLTNSHAEVTHFDCVVIGGGQAGLAMGGRLKAMGMSYVVLEKHANVGDNWKTRYGSARLHTIREYAHLPFDRTFPDHYQEWLSKDDLAHGYQAWVKKYDINVWTGTKAKQGTWDSANSQWTLEIEQADSTRSITCSDIILAGGAGGQVPVMPDYPGREIFGGEVLHSAQYNNASGWKGKHSIVIGTANTAHDVAEDMLGAGCASVTMIQRSRTFVVPRTHYKRTADILYNAQIPTTVADRAFLTPPLAISHIISQKVLHTMAAAEPERYAALEAAGFKVEPFGSIPYQLYERMGGHYMDVGASEKIPKGLIKVKSDALPTHYTKSGLAFDDGTELKADVVVFATGFKGNARYLVNEIFGEEVAEKMGDFWGLDKYGEIKGAFKPGGHPGLWYHGGTIGQARYMSRFIALSLKAQKLGTPIQIYSKSP